MGFKLDRKDCEDVLRGNIQHVLEERLNSLGEELVNATDVTQVYRLQGFMKALIEVSHLRDKATRQLKNQ